MGVWLQAQARIARAAPVALFGVDGLLGCPDRKVEQRRVVLWSEVQTVHMGV